MTWSDWRAHFEANARRSMPPIPAALEDVPDAMRTPLLSCLRRFQLGESGGGRIATQIDGVDLPGSDDDHRAAVKLFVREEGRHAEVLARLVTALGGELLPRHLSHGLFAWCRNLFGVRWKLLVLNLAEVIGIACYRRVAARLPAGPTRAALAELIADEEHHLAFHSALFAGQPSGRALTRAAWWALGLGASVAVIVDHGPALGGLGISRASLWVDLCALLDEGDRRMAPCAARSIEGRD